MLRILNDSMTKSLNDSMIFLIYSVRHTTTFRYEPAVRESVMEVRLQPRSDGEQRCLSFTLDVEPSANIMQYRDFMGNTVHHFDIAGRTREVKVTAQSAVEVQSVPGATPGRQRRLGRPGRPGCWQRLLGNAFAQPLCTIQPELEQLAEANSTASAATNPLELC
jgi:transglutaminase-like putative cysteine protease